MSDDSRNFHLLGFGDPLEGVFPVLKSWKQPLYFTTVTPCSLFVSTNPSDLRHEFSADTVQASTESDAGQTNTSWFPRLHLAGHYPSSLDIVLHRYQKFHVYLVSRGFGTKWISWIGTCSRTAGEWKPRNDRVGADLVGTAIARTIDIQSDQETDRKVAHLYIRSLD